jgi:Uma2 family endonuclease
LPQYRNDKWLFQEVDRYSQERPEIINFVASGARVFVPQPADITAPEPDLAAYKDFPFHLASGEVNWEDVSPILVGEVLSADDPGKDLIRNVALYLRVPSIREYWILDPREDPDRPTLYVHRRHGQRWLARAEVRYGETYTTSLLPGFRLRVDPRQ